jgi:hypothetical protein
VLRHGESDTGVEPLKEYFRCARLKDPEEADEEESDQNDQREGDDHDRLDRKRKCADEFLHGQGNDQGKESDGQGVGDDESEDALFEADHQRQPGNFPPEGAANRLQL